MTSVFQQAVSLDSLTCRTLLSSHGDVLGEYMSEEQPPRSPETPEGRPRRGPGGQPPRRNPEGPKPFWRRTPFLMASPPLALVTIITIVGCVSSSSTGSPTASFSASAQASQASGSPSASASGSSSPSFSPSSSSPPPPPPTSAPAPTTSAPHAGCYPLSNEGTCYEPGEYCRKTDHGASGIAGDGKAITCEDNDGWRWEPS